LIGWSAVSEPLSADGGFPSSGESPAGLWHRLWFENTEGA